MVNFYKYAHRANWFLIFHHSSKNSEYFDETNWLMFNSENRYSALGTLEKYKISGKFEFLLEYPQLEGYNRFKQTSNPTVSDKIEGYQPIHLSWTSYSFGGLALSSNTGFTFIDGSPGTDGWFYAIASKVPWVGDYIPGAFDKGYDGCNTTEVNLFVRVPIVCSAISYRKNYILCVSLSLLIILS